MRRRGRRGRRRTFRSRRRKVFKRRRGPGSMRLRIGYRM